MGLLTIPGAAAQDETDYDRDNDGLIEVADLAQLNAIRWDLDGDGAADDSANEASYAAAYPDPATGMGCPSTGCIGYELTANLNFSGSTWASGEGWLPIGHFVTPYAAIFEGNDRTLSNLYVNRSTVFLGGGLFSHLGADGEIRNVRLQNVNVQGLDDVGALVGANKGTISHSSATGSVSGTGQAIGGLVGSNGGSIGSRESSGAMISHSSAAVTVTTFGEAQVGGLAGDNKGTIRHSSATGKVMADPSALQQDIADPFTQLREIGGLVGRNIGKISDSHATGDVFGLVFVGGLVGLNEVDDPPGTPGEITNSYATGNVEGYSLIGGLVGVNRLGGTIRASYATGDVAGVAPDYLAGGLIGRSFGSATVIASYATGKVTGASYIGGLLGYDQGSATFTASYWDTDTSGVTTSAGGTGKTTEELQTPTDYTDSDPDTEDIYAEWNVDVDDDLNTGDPTTGGDDPWDFGTTSQYPVLKVAFEAPVVRGTTDLDLRENSVGSIARYKTSDPEQDLLDWSLGGIDGSFFSIDNQGYLTFNNPPDYENPADSGRDNVYNVTVVATHDSGLTGELEVTVTVTDQNEAPQVSGQQSLTFTENQPTDRVLAIYSATDPEDPSAAITRWSLTGADAGDFAINENGDLSFRNVPDYESPADSGRDNLYNFSVRASDGRNYGYLPVTVTVEDVNEPPEISSGGRTEFSYLENATASLYTFRATDPERADIAWSLSGPDAGDFAIGENGALSFRNIPDHENPADFGSDNVYNVTVVATDDRGLTGELDIIVTVTDTITVLENSDQTIAVYSGADPEDPSALITRWSLTGPDAGDFEINENGDLSFRNVPDHEKPADSGRDNVYNFSVRASDGRNYGYLEVTVVVEDVNEPPEISSGGRTEFSYRENGAASLYTYRATDPERAAIAWSLTGPDAGDFAIGETGVLAFARPPDHENPADSGRDNVYNVTVVASDAALNSSTLEVTVTVTDQNEGPEISGQQSLTFTENQTTDRVLATYSGADPEDPSALITRWSLTGADAGDFAINENGDLSFRNVPDHEKPADSGRDNLYNFSVRASDGRNYGYLPVTVVVEDVNEPPEISSGGRTEFSYRENGAASLYTYRATDPERAAIAWSLTGPDAGDFAIGENGVLAFAGPPDHENPADSGRDNLYNVTVVATDDRGLTDELEVTVTVTDQNEGPEISVISTFTRAYGNPTDAGTVHYIDGGGNRESRTSEPTAPVARQAGSNSPATGQPTVTGTARVGETLSADTSGSADEDGLDHAAFSFQWVANDGSADSDIPGATASIYTPTDANVGKTIKMRVSFTDDAGNEETLTSAPTEPVEVRSSASREPEEGRPNTPATGLPTISGTAQVGETLTAGTSGISDAEDLTNATFSYQWLADDAAIAGASGSTYTLAAADEGKAIKVQVSFTDAAGNDETLTSEATDAVAAAPQPNSPATGAPTISGTARVGETLTTNTSGIADEDGLSGAAFSYQWVSSDGTTDTDIRKATDSTYKLVADDAGKAISVRVSFTDDGGTEETLTSAATEQVLGDGPPGVPGKPTITAGDRELTLSWEPPGDNGSAPAKIYRIEWRRDGQDYDTNQWTTVDETTYTVPNLANGISYTVRVKARNDNGYGPPSEEASGTPTSGSAVDLDTPVLSEPEILHHRMVKLDWQDIEGADSYEVQFYNSGDEWVELPADDVEIAVHGSSAVVSNLDGGLTWLRVRAVSCVGASKWSKIEELYGTNASDWEDVPVPTVEAGDEAEPCPEDLDTPDNSPATGAATISGTAQVGETLTADTSSIEDTDGLENVTFSYQWLADDAAIAGATGNTYTLAAADEGKAVKVRVSFTDDAGNEETLTSAPTDAVDARPNSPATGAPTINGTAQVGETLTADTSGIEDADGLANAVFSYQWVSSDGTTDTDIQDATGSTYTLEEADEGKAIKVEVSFTDDAGNEETLTSAPTDAVAAVIQPNSPATGAPTINGTAQLGETLTTNTSGIADEDGLSGAAFSYQWLAADTAIQDATGSTYTLEEADEGKTIGVRVSFTDDAGNEETLTSAPTDAVAAVTQPNNPATGAPTINGTVQVGETLTADTSGIEDADGLANAVFSYQWVSSDGTTDTDIQDATGSTYTLEEADEGKTIGVRVSFTDDAGNEETLTSTPTDAVAAVTQPNSPATGAPTINGTAQLGETLTTNTSGIADEDGLSGAAFSYQWLAADTAIQDATGSTYTLEEADEGKTIGVRVSFTDDAGNEETLTSAATDAVDARPNSPATGGPTISGTAQVGETLTADTSGIEDADGLTNATFRYQWLADDAAIAGATGNIYTLAAADEGKTIGVRVSFSDDAGNEETLTSAPTDAVAAATPLTARFENVPGTHNGTDDFTFELRFSEEFAVSFRTLRDAAFEVTGGSVTGAQRLVQGSNIGWKIHVRPDSDADVTVVLPATSDCGADGAICTADDKPLSNRLEETISGPSE